LLAGCTLFEGRAVAGRRLAPAPGVAGAAVGWSAVDRKSAASLLRAAELGTVRPLLRVGAGVSSSVVADSPLPLRRWLFADGGCNAAAALARLAGVLLDGPSASTPLVVTRFQTLSTAHCRSSRTVMK